MDRLLDIVFEVLLFSLSLELARGSGPQFIKLIFEILGYFAVNRDGEFAPITEDGNKSFVAGLKIGPLWFY